jgi:CBS domain containing-hemolysin-like protein
MSDGHFGYRFLLLALLIGLNGFLAGAEVALLSSRKSRLRQMADGGHLGAQAAMSLLANPERLLSVVQVGVTLCSLGLGWAGEQTLFDLISRMLAPVKTPTTEGILHGVAFALSFAVMTFSHVVVGEVVPKNLAIEKADRLAVIIAPALLVFYRVSEPFVFVVEKSAMFLNRLIGLKGEQHGGGHSAEELKYIIASSRTEGHLPHFEETAIQRLLELQNYYVREIMVPRHAIVSISINATLDQVLRAFMEHQYSRLPVYDKQPEDLIGVVHYKDLMRVWEERKIAAERKRPTRPFRLRNLMRKPLFVPETKPLNQLMDEFRSHHTHMAMVVDEFGTISGLVTLEDMLEQVFGEIEDEHDERRTRPSQTDVLELDGTVNIRDLEMQYEITLPADAGFETLAGFLLSQFGDFPKVGDTLEYDGRRFTIVDMERNRIGRVRIERIVLPVGQ